jgi:transposase-like protein
VKERAVRPVLNHQSEYASQYATIQSVAARIGCNPEMLRGGVRHAERDAGYRPA